MDVVLQLSMPCKKWASFQYNVIHLVIINVNPNMDQMIFLAQISIIAENLHNLMFVGGLR